MLRDIINARRYSSIWDKVIIDALQNGHISCARVQKQLGGEYISARMLIETTQEYGYFDEMQRNLISVEDYKAMVARR